MNTAELLERARTLLSEWAGEAKTIEPNRLDVAVEPSHLTGAARALVQSHWGYLSAITGLDLGTDKDLEVLYHFCNGPAVVTLRVPVSKAEPVVESISEVVRYAGLFELELSEMLGVRIRDIAPDAHLYLPEDWPENTYPLRKDFQHTPKEEKRTDA